MAQTEEITFREVIDALLNVDVPFHPRYLYRLADLNNEEVKMLEEVWQQVPVWRRQALLQDVEAMGERDMVLSFEALARVSLRDSEPGVRLPAIRALWDFERARLIDNLIEILEMIRIWTCAPQQPPPWESTSIWVKLRKFRSKRCAGWKQL